MISILDYMKVRDELGFRSGISKKGKIFFKKDDWIVPDELLYNIVEFYLITEIKIEK